MFLNDYVITIINTFTYDIVQNSRLQKSSTTTQYAHFIKYVA